MVCRQFQPLKNSVRLLGVLLVVAASHADAWVPTPSVAPPRVTFNVVYGQDTGPFFNQATLTSWASGAGDNLQWSFEIGPTTAYGVTVQGRVGAFGSGTAEGLYNDLGLNIPHAVYHFRAKVTGSTSTCYSKDAVFRLPNNAPSFTHGFGISSPASVVAVQPGERLYLSGDSFFCWDVEDDPLHITSFSQPSASQGKLTKYGSGLVFDAAPGYTGGFQTWFKLADSYGAETGGTNAIIFVVDTSLTLDRYSETLPPTGPDPIDAGNIPSPPPGTQEVVVIVSSSGSVGAFSQASWIQVLPHKASLSSYPSQVKLWVAPNATLTARTGVVLIGTRQFVIEQSGAIPPERYGFLPSPPRPGSVGTLYEPWSIAEAISAGWPVRYSISSGKLPPGLALSPAGVIAGIPRVAGSYDFTVKVSNSAGSLEVPALIDVAAMPEGIVGLHVGCTPSSTTLKMLGGAFQFNVTTRGSYSGFVTFDGTRYGFNGTSLQPGAQGPVLLASIPRKGLQPWRLELDFNRQPFPGPDAARLLDGTGNQEIEICQPWSAQVAPLDMAALSAGYYAGTMGDMLESVLADSGALSLKVIPARDRKSGTGAMTWRFIDGTVLTFSSPLVRMEPSFSASLPVSLQRVPGQRLLQGALFLRPEIMVPASALQTSLGGTLWRSQMPATDNSDLTLDLALDVSGWNWTPPATGSNALRTEPGTELVDFQFNAPGSWPQSFTLSNKSVAMFGPATQNPAGFALAINPTTGIWTGSYSVSSTAAVAPAKVKALMMGAAYPMGATGIWGGSGCALQPQFEPGTNHPAAPVLVPVSFSTVEN